MSRKPRRSIQRTLLQPIQVTRQIQLLLVTLGEVRNVLLQRPHPHPRVQQLLDPLSGLGRGRLDPQGTPAKMREEHVDGDDAHAAEERDHVGDDVDGGLAADAAELEVGRACADLAGKYGAVGRGLVVVVEAVDDEGEGEFGEEERSGRVGLLLLTTGRSSGPQRQ